MIIHLASDEKAELIPVSYSQERNYVSAVLTDCGQERDSKTLTPVL